MPAVETVGFCAVEVKLLGPVQLQVVVPEPVAEAVNPTEELLHVSTPPVPVTVIADDTEQGPFSLNTLYCSI